MRDVSHNPRLELQEYFTDRPIPQALSCLGEADGGQLSGRELTRLLEEDPETLERVRRLGGGSTPRQLLERCGPSELQRRIWLAAIGASLAPPEQPLFREFWLHALRTRAIVRLLIERCCPSIDPAPLMLPALLHDAGKLVYHACYPEDAARITAWCGEHRSLWVEAERALGLPSHGALGSALVEFLGLPEAVSIACRHHEADDLDLWLGERIAAPEELMLVALANTVDRLSDPGLDAETTARLEQALHRALSPAGDQIERMGLELTEVLAAADRELERFALAA